MIILSLVTLHGCTSWVANEKFMAADYYEVQAALEDQCRMAAQALYPGYPAKRGVLTNYWFTRAYDRCLEKKALNGEIPGVSGL